MHVTAHRTRPITRLLGAASLCLALTVAPGLSSAAKATADPQVAGEVLLRLETTGALAPLLARYPFSLVAQFGARPIYRLKLIGQGSVAGYVEQLTLEPGVLAAEVNTVHRTPEARKNVVWAIGGPQDYAAQWAPQALRLQQAHALSKGSGVRVAVLDTGVDRKHPALAGHILPGFDFVDNDADAHEVGTDSEPGFGHGTHVAGLVLLAAPEAAIVPYRVLDGSGQGNDWVLAEAMLRAVDPDGNPATDDGAHVINVSLGTLERSGVLEAALQVVTCGLVEPDVPGFTDPGYNADKDRCRSSRGAVVVAAAGNGGSKAEKQYPAAEGEYGLLAITATQANGNLAAFSNYGSWVEVAAPGDRVTSTIPGGRYGTWSGTSMAAPLAAGTAALVRAREPQLTAKEVARRLEDTSPRLCNAQQGRLDALNSLLNVRGRSECE